MGTPAAERALRSIDWGDDKELVSGLVHLGSLECIKAAIDLARRPDRGVKWLLDAARHTYMVEGYSSDRFRRDVEVAPLLDYVKGETLDAEVYEYLRSLLHYLDGIEVRKEFVHWWNLRGTPADIKVKALNGKTLSDIAMHELVRRGDSSVLSEHLNEEIEHCTTHRVADHTCERLARFNRADVLATLRRMLINEVEARLAAVIDILGRIGDGSDAARLHPIADLSSNARVANAAFEAVVRLTDPLRLAQHW